MSGRDIIVENSGWAIGDGESLNVWDSARLSLSQKESPMGPAPEALVELKVSDLFLAEKNEWDLAKIRQFLPFEENKIRLLKPSLSGAPDKLMWLKSATGEFTTKTGYSAALPLHLDQALLPQGNPCFNWKKNVWKLHTAPKVKLFVWKTLHGALPVGEQLVARQIKVDGKCKLCGLPESIDHLFLHCNFAKQVWKSAPVWPSIDYSGTIELRSEWNSLCSRQNLPPMGLSMGALTPWILWQIWKARNSLVFKDKGFMSMAIAAAREWNSSQGLAPVPRRSQPVRVIPQDNCVLVRSDAAWNETNKIAGLGWTIKTQNRVSSFSSPMRFVGSLLIAEGLALREAVEKCRDLGLTKIRCESDCAQLIKALTFDHPLAELYGIVADIEAVALSFDFVSFTWISRERNRDADSLAKQVLSAELALMASPNNV